MWVNTLCYRFGQNSLETLKAVFSLILFAEWQHSKDQLFIPFFICMYLTSSLESTLLESVNNWKCPWGRLGPACVMTRLMFSDQRCESLHGKITMELLASHINSKLSWLQFRWKAMYSEDPWYTEQWIAKILKTKSKNTSYSSQNTLNIPDYALTCTVEA